MRKILEKYWYLILLLPWVIGLLWSSLASLFNFDEVAGSQVSDVAAVEQAVILTVDGDRGNSSSYDATDTYVYFLYTERAAYVNAFDHEGNYQFSIHFSARENGSMFIRCHNGYLYVSTKYGNVFVFDGKQQIARMSKADATEQGFDVHWFTSRDHDIKILGDTMHVYDPDGNLTSTIKMPTGVLAREIYGVVISIACILVIAIQMLRKRRLGK